MTPFRRAPAGTRLKKSSQILRLLFAYSHGKRKKLLAEVIPEGNSCLFTGFYKGIID